MKFKWALRPRRAVGASELDAVQRAQPWIAAALALALGTALGVVPPWCWASVLALIALKALAWRRRWRLGRRVLLPLAALALGAWLAGFSRHASGPAVTAFFALVLALKWLEADPARGRRDALLLLWASCVLAALGATHQFALLSLLLLVTHALVLAAALAALHGQRRPAQLAARLLGLALPLAALLFVLTPRVSGPLWDFGLALGLPIAATAPRGQGLGSRDSLQPGQMRSAALEDGTMLVARFDGYQPAAAEMYWRGPVFWDFDGRRWTPGPGWGNRSERMARGYRRAAAWAATFQPRGEPLRYSLRVAGHGGPWLYALDLPATLPPESYLTHDGQLLSMTPLREETRYDAAAWRDWRAVAPRLAEPERLQALALPAAQLPQLAALGRQIAQAEPAAAGRIDRVLGLFDPARFRLDSKAPSAAGAQAYEDFLFVQRAGGADQFAAGAVLLLRAAGVPARLVTGFRGGRLMGTSGYVLVKQSHAHAWVEAWDDARGWQRLDPVDRVRAPAAPRRGAAPEPAAAPGATTAATPPSAAADAAPATPWWQAMDGWVLHYDAARRAALLDGLAEAGHGALRPALLAVLLAAALALPLLAWRHRPRQRGTDPLAAAWDELARRLARAGLAVPPGRCPSALAQDLAGRAEPWAPVAAEIVGTWLRLRYQPGGAPRGTEPQRALLRRVRRFEPRAFRSDAAAPGTAAAPTPPSSSSATPTR
ncbi:MAG: DUF3488 and transglutaminase-like domain-containing protein [Rubrivivax sp.]